MARFKIQLFSGKIHLSYLCCFMVLWHVQSYLGTICWVRRRLGDVFTQLSRRNQTWDNNESKRSEKRMIPNTNRARCRVNLHIVIAPIVCTSDRTQYSVKYFYWVLYWVNLVLLSFTFTEFLLHLLTEFYAQNSVNSKIDNLCKIDLRQPAM